MKNTDGETDHAAVMPFLKSPFSEKLIIKDPTQAVQAKGILPKKILLNLAPKTVLLLLSHTSTVSI